ncbi:MAG: hypothetical protein AB8B89_00455 [Gammaproteobacteria bacterium]
MKVNNWMIMTFVIVAMFISGCASQPKALDETFWTQKDTTVAVVISKLPEKMVLYKEGGQGLLDIAISNVATDGVNKKLNELDPTPFIKVRGEFVAKLREEGYTVIDYEELIDLKSFPEREKKVGYSQVDYSQLFEDTGADQIIIISLLGYGASRGYYGFIPITKPQGMAAVEGVMLDKEQKILWNTGNSINDSFIKEPVVGEWKQKPDYPNLLSASKRALEKSKVILSDKFFNR